MSNGFKIGSATVITLVLLRVAIGWHFLHEGWYKYKHPSESSEGYLRQARGPFAEYYLDMVDDYYGERRLDLVAMFNRWQNRHDAVIQHYGFNEEQKQIADRYLQNRMQQLDEFLQQDVKGEDGKPKKDDDGNVLREDKDELREFKQKLSAWHKAEEEAEVQGIPFERERHYKQLKELQATSAPWLAEVDNMDEAYNESLEELVTPEQRAAVGEYTPEPSHREQIEEILPYALLAIGFGLMAGLLTRLCALGGAFFLLTAVVLPQLTLPGYYPLPPPQAGHIFIVSKEAIEMLALLVLATTAVGRWGGLDYFIHHLILRPVFQGDRE